MKGEKVVIPLSGGITSTTLLYYLNEKEFTVLPITFDWKQFEKTQAIEGIKRACSKLNLPLKTVDFGGIKDLLEGAREDHRVIMNRDLIYLSISMAYSLTSDCPLIYFPFYLMEPNSAGQYGEYVGLLRNTIETIAGKKLHLAYDFWMNEEYEIVELASVLGVDFNDTWSCYYNDEYHCGKCGGCLKRKEAFKRANITDTTIYEKTPLKENVIATEEISKENNKSKDA